MSVRRSAALALGLALSLAPLSGLAAAERQLTLTDEIHTLVLEHMVAPVDLDGDGVDEFVVLGRDGVAQLYDAHGVFRWSQSTDAVAEALGAHHWRRHSMFEGDYRGLVEPGGCRTTDHGVAFTDRNGDGLLDIVAATWLGTLTPVAEQRSYLVELDGRTGDILGLHRFEGWVTNVALAGGSHVFVTEEDGQIEPPGPTDFFLERGSGGTTRVHRYDLDAGAPVWTHDTGVGWGQATAVAVAPFADEGPDVAVALTSGTARSRCSPDTPEDAPSGNQVLVLDGETGQPRWSAPAPRFVRQLLAVPGAGASDLVTRSRGADGSALRRLDGRTGEPLWTSALPSGAVVWDALGYGDDVAVAYSAAAPAGGRLPYAGIVDGDDGVLRTSTAVETTPAQIDRMRLATAHLDVFAARELVVRTDRAVTAVSAAGQVLWTRQALEAPHVLAVSRTGSGEQVWIKGPIPDPQPSREPPDELFNSVEKGRYRLFGLDGRDGAGQGSISLVGPMVAATRLDVNGDGLGDRIAGGASETLFAFEGGSQRLLWHRFLGEPELSTTLRGEQAGNVVLDIALEDVDGDGNLDLIVQAHLEVFALKAADGRMIWSYRHGPSMGAGRWNGFELTDLDGDGVRDVVLATGSARQGGFHTIESAHVVAVNGATGRRLWHVPFPPQYKRVNGLDVGDVNGDGVDDVAVSLDLAAVPGLMYTVMVLDGRLGVPLWQFSEHNGTAGGQFTTPSQAVRMIDAGGDGRMDVAVQVAGSPSFDTRVRVHDGASGAELWSALMASPDVGPGNHGMGIYRGVLDPGEPPVLLAATKARNGAETFVQAFTADGEVLFTQTAGVGIIWDLQVGDLTGDGFGDIVVPALSDLSVIGGADAAAGAPRIVAHRDKRFPSKVRVVDSDRDGVMEIEALRDPQGWPVSVGQVNLVDPSLPRPFGTLRL